MTILKGIVTSTKMNQTAVVKIDHLFRHPLYQKAAKRSKNYLVHCDQKVVEGTEVKIAPCRPVSKLVRWRII